MKLITLSIIRFLIITITVLGLLLSSCTSPNPETLFVDVNNMEASDINVGTQNNPLRTIQEAVDRANAGSTIYVRQGTYNETVEITKSGTADAMIVIKAYDNDHVIINSTSYACFNFEGAEYIEISGFELTGAYFSDTIAHGGAIRAFPEQEAAGYFGANNCIFSNNIIHDNDAGIWLVLSGNNTIKNNIIWNSNEAPIRLKHCLPYNDVYNNLTYDNGMTEQWGICYYASPYTIIRHNTSVEAKGGAIYLYEGTSNLNGAQPGSTDFAVPCSNCEVYDNICVVYEDGAPLVLGYSSLTDRDSVLNSLYPPLNNYYQHNLFYHPGEPNVIVSWGDLITPITWWTSPIPTPIFLTLEEFQQKYPGYGDNSIVADPLFVNPGNHDYRLQTNSPAKGAASDGTDLGVNFADLPTQY